MKSTLKILPGFLSSKLKYGNINDGTKNGHIKNLKQDLIKKREKEMLAILQNKDVKSSTLYHGAIASLCATICKNRYEKVAGSQD